MLLLIGTLFASCDESENPLVQQLPARGIQEEILSHVNRLRTEGCNCGKTYYPPVGNLSWDKKLEDAANRHSSDMSQTGTFSHVGSDGSSADQRIRDAGYQALSFGENLAKGYSTVVNVMNGWRTSTGHCKILMDPNATEMGVSKVGDYWTQILASPATGK